MDEGCAAAPEAVQPVPRTDDARVVVIGSGPAGAMAAHELVRRGIPVVMLESGTHLPSGLTLRGGGRNVLRHAVDPGLEERTFKGADGAVARWRYSLSPGGLSNVWTGAALRFAPEDFTEGERLHERYRWPLDYDALAPFYESAERLLEITAAEEGVPNLPVGHAAWRRRLPRDWEEIAASVRTCGQGLTVLPLAHGPPWMLARRGTAFNSFTQLVLPLRRSPRFTLLTGAHALRLEWSGSSRRVEAVIYRRRSDGKEHRLRAAAFVVACGALNSTRLLFNSGCRDFPMGLGNSNGLLGRYLHDHPLDWFTVEFDRSLSRLVPSSYLTRAPPSQSPPLIANGWVLGVASSLDRALSFTPLKVRTVGVQVVGTMVPEAAHHVRPSAAASDEFGLPHLEIHLCYPDDAVTNMHRARTRLLEIMEDAGVRGRASPTPPRLEPGRSFHYAGTARMHASPEHGVVDAWNRLYDAPNVLCTDAACFTTGPEKNPTLTIMALAARAAARLATDLGAR